MTVGPFRAVVIGCGRIGAGHPADLGRTGVRSHAEAYQRHPSIELVGVADVDEDAAAAASARWSVPAFADGIEMCAEARPDVVSVCTPDPTHGELAAQVIAASRPQLLFIEKPMAMSVASAERLARIAADARTWLLVNYSRRFSAAFQRLRQELRAGRHGRPLQATLTYGKGLLHNGTHAIDLMRYWFGDPSTAVRREDAWGPPGDGTVGAEFSFDSGLIFRLQAFDERVATVFQLELMTSRSVIRFWNGGRTWEFGELADDAAVSGHRTFQPTGRASTDPLFREAMTDCLENAVHNIVDTLEGRASPACSAADGVAALYWAERLRPTA